jgi:hypothetical protein
MAIELINIGSAPNDGTGDTIRDAYDKCNGNFTDLDTSKFDVPTGSDTQYIKGDGTIGDFDYELILNQGNRPVKVINDDSYTFIAEDKGKYVIFNGSTLILNAGVFNIGDTLLVYNGNGNDITISGTANLFPNNLFVKDGLAFITMVSDEEYWSFNCIYITDKTRIGLGSVDNTSDLDKPISNDTQDALDALQSNTDNQINEIKWKWPVKACSTANVNLSGTLPTTMDGISIAYAGVGGLRILLKDQTNQAENGIYEVGASGWTIPVDFDTFAKTVFAYVYVAQGDVNQGRVFYQDSITAGIYNFLDVTLPTGSAITNTSQLINDGENGVNSFITALDIPTFASADKMVTVGRNSTGSTLYKGTIVYISGSTGNRPNFVKSLANAESTSAGTFGVIEDDILNNANGNCVTAGAIDDLDTRSTATHPFTSDTLADGDTIYLSPTTAGYITNVKPSAPNHLVYIGKVIRTSPTNGTIVYRIQNGYELDEIHDVAIASKTNNDVLQYESASNLWKNKALTTSSVASSTNKNYVTDAQSTVIGNTSGTNTGDETTATIKTKLGITTLSGSNTGDQDLSGLVVKNTAITGATKTKVTYDSKGLVTAGADATTSDIADSTNKRYVTDAYLTLLGTITQSGLTAYTDTITWTATTAPSGTTNFSYNWTKVGNQVTLTINLLYGTNGTGVTAVSMVLPSGSPTPVKPTGLSGASNLLYQGSGKMMTSVTSTTSVNALASLRSNSANNGFELIIVQGAGTFTTASITIQYFTA